MVAPVPSSVLIASVPQTPKTSLEVPLPLHIESTLKPSVGHKEMSTKPGGLGRGLTLCGEPSLGYFHHKALPGLPGSRQSDLLPHEVTASQKARGKSRGRGESAGPM